MPKTTTATGNPSKRGFGNKTPDNLRQWFAARGSYPVVAEEGGVIGGVAMLGADGSLALCNENVSQNPRPPGILR